MSKVDLPFTDDMRYYWGMEAKREMKAVEKRLLGLVISCNGEVTDELRKAMKTYRELAIMAAIITKGGKILGESKKTKTNLQWLASMSKEKAKETLRYICPFRCPADGSCGDCEYDRLGKCGEVETIHKKIVAWLLEDAAPEEKEEEKKEDAGNENAGA